MAAEAEAEAVAAAAVEAETVAAAAKDLQEACTQGVMTNPPSCDGRCRTALQAARSGGIWMRIRAAMAPGLVAVILQVCGKLRA